MFEARQLWPGRTISVGSRVIAGEHHPQSGVSHAKSVTDQVPALTQQLVERVQARPKVGLCLVVVDGSDDTAVQTTDLASELDYALTLGSRVGLVVRRLGLNPGSEGGREVYVDGSRVVTDDPPALPVPQNGYGDIAEVAGFGEVVGLAEQLKAVDRVRPGALAKSSAAAIA